MNIKTGDTVRFENYGLGNLDGTMFVERIDLCYGRNWYHGYVISCSNEKALGSLIILDDYSALVIQ
jgi:hypothetical protein